jgi:hypothetical protein
MISATVPNRVVSKIVCLLLNYIQHEHRYGKLRITLYIIIIIIIIMSN